MPRIGCSYTFISSSWTSSLMRGCFWHPKAKVKYNWRCPRSCLISVLQCTCQQFLSSHFQLFRRLRCVCGFKKELKWYNYSVNVLKSEKVVAYEHMRKASDPELSSWTLLIGSCLLACAHNIISRIWLSRPSASPGVRGSVSSSSCTCHSKHARDRNKRIRRKIWLGTISARQFERWTFPWHYLLGNFVSCRV